MLSDLYNNPRKLSAYASIKKLQSAAKQTKVTKTKKAISKLGYKNKMLIHYTDLSANDSREILIALIMS